MTITFHRIKAHRISMGECNTILSAYTLYRHLGLCCAHPSIWGQPCSELVCDASFKS